MTTPQYDVPLRADSIETFSYQVAGHGALMRVGEGKICKPLIPIELNFYKSIDKHQDLLPYTAGFFGTIQLTFTKDDISAFFNQLTEQEQITFNKIRESNKETDTNPNSSEGAEHISPIASATQVAANDSFKEESLMNPWSAKVGKAQFTKLLETGILTKKYMVLEDLTSKYKCPCICDIKIGTRQHGDDAAPDKRLRHQKKVMTTTSYPLGLRMCGTQVFQVAEKTYKYTTKYDGRKLTTETIKDAIAQYFYNGQVFRHPVLLEVIARLKEFQKVMQDMDSQFRFYSTSLLLMYEGCDTDYASPKVDIRMVDFAHTFVMSKGDIKDDGYLFGLQNLINILEQISAESSQQGDRYGSASKL